MSVLGKRLKEARKAHGLSQEKLAVLAGIDEMSASSRMNQYERGKHTPDPVMIRRIAEVLNVPASYFYADDDAAAWLQVVFHRMPAEQKAVILATAQSLFSSDSPSKGADS